MEEKDYQRRDNGIFVNSTSNRRDVSVNSRVSSSTLTAENPRVGENDSTFVPVFVSITDTCLTISGNNVDIPVGGVCTRALFARYLQQSIRENRSASRACHHCDLSCIDVMDNESFSDLLGSTGTPPRPALLSLSLSHFLSGCESQTSTIEPHYSTNICGDGEERKKTANANRSFFKTPTVFLLICLWSVVLKIV
ncbi:hypothetical protein HZH68_011586 [Vespula germanica]|uniref:Uncharacterized protein n=1 Tax=Vespula germanica TaxID=30212 RepID=A0A834N2P9_VESGE|nr:hypothetical protein HZH68_011586 [Vespula germanica]